MSNIKESPFLGLTGMGGGGTGLALGGTVAKQTFLDEVFATALYEGNATSSRDIVNGIDLAGEGGFVWTKNRDSGSYGHNVFDTERGIKQMLITNSNVGQALEGNTVTQFNSNGFRINDDNNINKNNEDYATFSFRRAKGFFDIITWDGSAGSGSSSTRTLSHSLGAIPGQVIIKRTDGQSNWWVYHRSLPTNKIIYLNESNGQDNGGYQYYQSVSSTNITVGTELNENGRSYVAYIFAGGESTADTARSVDLDGNDWLTVPNSSDFNTGSGDFTIEAWIKPDASATSYNAIWSYGNPHEFMWRLDGTAEKIQVGFKGTEGGSYVVELATTGTYSQRASRSQWSHVAVVRNGSKFSLYLNGNLADVATYGGSIAGAASDSGQVGNYIASGNPSTYPFKGSISNFRFVKGTAVYTESFKVPYKPLENITNTKLLCCNNSSVTGSTVAPVSTNTYSINVTASGSSAYTLSGNDRNGSVSGNNVTVTVNVGDTLNFAVNASGHPFYIRVSNGGANVSTPAASNQGAQSGTVSWTPNTAGTYYYQCGNHSGMIGTITVNAASGSITSNGDPTASSDSPFDDPDAFKFGTTRDQNIIKCGSWVGNGDDNEDIEINLGWEPTWLLVKQTANSGNWQLVTDATSWPVSGNWETLRPNLPQSANDSTETGIQLTPTGFTIVKNYGNFNTDGDTHIFVAIRRADGYVGKPIETGTDVFAMAYGNGSGTNPSYVSNFPVDFALSRQPASNENWYTASRLYGTNYVTTNTGNSTYSSSNFVFDHSNGWRDGSAITAYMSWMWKRHAGCDIINYIGTGPSNGCISIKHNLAKIPEMIWIKNTKSNNENWYVYHNGLNGGVNPHNYHLTLNATSDESTSSDFFGTAPTSTTVTIAEGVNQRTNGNGEEYLMVLFASVEGVSKVGVYDGSSSTQTITTGFQPRFFWQKRITGSGEWHMVDTTRGWGSGTDKFMYFNGNNAQANYDFGAPTATGFTLTGGADTVSNTGEKYIYYAHA